MQKQKTEWQSVQGSRDRRTYRLPVPGGWLYLVHELDELGSIIGQLLTFVPKPPNKHGPERT